MAQALLMKAVLHNDIQRSKFSFSESFLTMKFFTQKVMKIKCNLGIFSTFGSDLLNKLATFEP
jgi:hypothetical protein